VPIQPGYDKYCTFQRSGTGGTNRIDVTGHSWAESVDKLDVSSSATSNLQALLAGIFRGEGNVKGFVDTTQYPWLEAVGIRAGQKGYLQLRIGTGTAVTDFFQVPCLITKVNEQTEHAGEVRYDFDVNFDALQGGTYTRPGD
jgi:hypothetical protein